MVEAHFKPFLAANGVYLAWKSSSYRKTILERYEMSSCIVSGCKSGYKTKANEGKKWHMFYPPKNDPDLFATWEQLCRPKDQKLSPKHRVCHKHFPDEMLITQVNIPLQDGCVYQSKLEYWRLKPGAFPCIFDGCGPGVNANSNKKAKTISRKRRRPKPVAEEDGRGSVPATTSAVDRDDSMGRTRGETDQKPRDGNIGGSRRMSTDQQRREGNVEESPGTSCAATQTEMDWFVVRDGKRDSERPEPTRPVLQERTEGRNGVFVPFAGLTGREKKYLLSIAGKSSAKTAEEGCADHTYRGNS